MNEFLELEMVLKSEKSPFKAGTRARARAGARAGAGAGARICNENKSGSVWPRPETRIKGEGGK